MCPVGTDCCKSDLTCLAALRRFPREERKPRDIEVEKADGEVVVRRPTDRGEHRALHGLTRSLIFNMVVGVTEGRSMAQDVKAAAQDVKEATPAVEMVIAFRSIANPAGSERIAAAAMTAP